MDHVSATSAAAAPRTVVVTGGNAGLGYACASALLRSEDGPPWHVVLACRDAARAQAAVDTLAAVAAAQPGRVEAMSLDLASLVSVRAFTVALTDRLRTGGIPPLHAVVCNAGVQAGTTQTDTADGFESTFGVNHLGHFALIHGLVPMLETPARVVVVASGTHDPAQKAGPPAPAWNDTTALAHGVLGAAADHDKPFAAGQRRYTTSKLANVYFTYALARHLPAGVTANAFDPGLMPGTGLLRAAPAPIRFLGEHVLPHAIPLMRRVMYPNVHTVADSGAALARLVTDPALADTTGRYYEGTKAIRSSQESYDTDRADTLWADSLTLTTQR